MIKITYSDWTTTETRAAYAAGFREAMDGAECNRLARRTVDAFETSHAYVCGYHAGANARFTAAKAVAS